MVDIAGIGNPLLDSTITVDEAFLTKHNLQKSEMTLVSEEEQDNILKDLDTRKLSNSPGGSVANTLAAAKALGGSTQFIGSIGEDEYGDIYEELITSISISSGLVRSETQQGKCLVLITPDGERTFATFLGASLDLKKEQVDEKAVSQAKALHIEGYQLDGENNTTAVTHAITVAKENNVLVSIDLADVGVVERHPDTLLQIISSADIIFANEAEAMAYTKAPDEVSAAQKLAVESTIAVVKIGSEGSIIAHKKKLYRISGFKVNVVNTNGAGDAYAGAFLQSIIQGKELAEAGIIASYMAAQVVAQEGARIERDITRELKEMKHLR